MTDIPKAEGSKYPTLMQNFETDDDLDNYVIDHAYMFVVIQIRPGGFVSGFGSNYTRTEIKVADFGGDTNATLAHAMTIGEGIYAETKKALLIYAVADFAGALGFNRPVRLVPPRSYKSKADKMRDERKAIAARKAERALKKDLKDKTPKLKAAVFKTDFAPKQVAMVEEEFLATDVPMARLLRD